jgi:hypothetical protein
MNRVDHRDNMFVGKLPERKWGMTSLAAELVRSLFWGLPRQEKHVAVLLAASDETCGASIFHHAGFVAPLAFWNDVLVPAWQREVLDGPPCIDEFHMVELRSPPWRKKYGLTVNDAESRIDAAVELLSKNGELCAIRSSIDGAHFEQHSSGLLFRLADSRRAPTEFVIDYPSFLGYIYTVLYYASESGAFPKVEKVDFVIEKKKEVFPAIHEFYEGLRDNFVSIGLPHFAQIMGELIPGDKKKIPLQAADVLCWHTQRHAASSRDPSKTFTEVDRRRYSKITQKGYGRTWEWQMIEELCDSLFEDWKKLNEIEKS